MQRSLHLQHHRHTGRLLAHEHTSYRALAVVLGVAGIAILSLSCMARVTADSLSLYVYARNPAPIPTQPAVITSLPASGLVTRGSALTVSGTCPVITPKVSVAIIDNNSLAGSSPCATDNTFTVPVTLTPGQNILVARTYTITGDSGPDSSPVIVTYLAPTPPESAISTPPISTNTSSPSNQSPSAPVNSAVTPLTISIDEPFIVFGPGKEAAWAGSITGGTTPYHVHIDWGDGTVGTFTEPTAGGVQFMHRYTSMHSYAITIRVTDTSGQSIVRQYAAVTPYITPVVNSTFTPPSSTLPLGGPGLIGLYGAYLLVLATFTVLWKRAHRLAYSKVPIRTPTRRASSKNRSHTRRVR